MSVTVFDLCKEIPVLNENGKFDIARVRRGEEVPSVADSLTPKKTPISIDNGEVKTRWFPPAELLSLRVSTVEVNGKVVGYQRPFLREHGRKIALALKDGKPFPAMDIACDGHGVLWAVDGQHRAVGGVLADVPVLGVVRRMTKEEQRELFAGQRRARQVDANVLILAGSGPYEQYIQEAVATSDHPWGEIVSAAHGSKTRITPKQMLDLLLAYVGNTGGTPSRANVDARWDRALADGLAPLIACFGNKKDNPGAFRPVALKGIGQAAMHVFRRNPNAQESDRERWMKHMPGFAFDGHLFVRSGSEMTYRLVTHWNKRLYEGRRVIL